MATKNNSAKSNSAKSNSAKPTRTAKADPADWGRVYILAGEPATARAACSAAIEESGAKRSWRVPKTEPEASISQALTARSFVIPPQAVVLSDPSADTARAVLLAVNSGTLRCRCVIVILSSDAPDGRIGLYAAAKKAGRVFAFSYILAGDDRGLAKFLGQWAGLEEMTLSKSVQSHLLRVAPTRSASISGSGGKRDTEVYDLLTLEAELSKAASVSRYEATPITVADVTAFCCFRQEVDVWALVRGAARGDLQATASSMLALAQTGGLTSGLWLLSSQLWFLTTVRGLYDAGIRGQEQIAQAMSLQSKTGAYLTGSWEEASPRTAAPVNAWRVQKALDQVQSIPLERLASQHQAVASALTDLRFKASETWVMPMLALALSGLFDYSSPFFHAEFSWEPWA